MHRRHPVRRFFLDNGLVIFMFSLFLVFIIGMSYAGYHHQNQELFNHGLPAESYGSYLVSGDFVEAVFENWESEFLQMAALVIATIFFYQRGSADSKRLRGKEAVDTHSRYSIIHATTFRTRVKSVGRALYSNSLSIALLALFLLSFVLHAFGGVDAYNQDQLMHGGQQLSVIGYVGTSTFWFESLQNWQSEFLAVGTLLLLSVYLRQRGSPESKPIGESNRRTGHE